MGRRISLLVLAVAIGAVPRAAVAAEKLPSDPAQRPHVLKAGAFQHYIDQFNRSDQELLGNVQAIPNSAVAGAFLARNIPLLDCPDRNSARSTIFAGGRSASTSSRRPTGSSLPNSSAAGGLGRQIQHHQLCREPSSSPKAAGSAIRNIASTIIRSFGFTKAATSAVIASGPPTRSGPVIVTGDDRLVKKLLSIWSSRTIFGH